MKQVEIFSRCDVVKLQTQMNEFLEELKGENKEVFDIKFTSSESEDGVPTYAALIIYSSED